MINQHFYIARLIARYLSDEIGEEEQAELTRWRNESPENERLFREICKEENIKQNMQKRQTFHTEDGWEGVQRKIQRHRFRHRILNICKYAAIFIFPVVVATVAIYKSSNEPQPLSQVAEQIVPGGKKAVLILDNGEAIDLKSTSGVELKEKDGTVIQVDSTALNYQQAPARTSEKLAYNKVNVPRGGEYQLILEDSTVVWLNSASELHYPVAFGNGVRRVVLKGEAYFQVKADKNRPFVVAVGGLDITVLGTEFNVSTFVGGEGVCATLVKGSVEVSVKGSRRVMLKPSEQAVYVNDKLSVREVNTLLYTAWKDGFYVFERQELEELLNTLARWYNVEIVYADDEIRHMHFTGRLKRYEDFGRCLSRIKMTNDVDFLIRGRTITVKRK